MPIARSFSPCWSWRSRCGRSRMYCGWQALRNALRGVPTAWGRSAAKGCRCRTTWPGHESGLLGRRHRKRHRLAPARRHTGIACGLVALSLNLKAEQPTRCGIDLLTRAADLYFHAPQSLASLYGAGHGAPQPISPIHWYHLPPARASGDSIAWLAFGGRTGERSQPERSCLVQASAAGSRKPKQPCHMYERDWVSRGQRRGASPSIAGQRQGPAVAR